MLIIVILLVGVVIILAMVIVIMITTSSAVISNISNDQLPRDSTSPCPTRTALSTPPP